MLLGERNKRRVIDQYIAIMTFLLILQSALRNVAVGADTYAYFRTYERISKESWDYIFGLFRKTYLEGEGKDPGYTVLCKSLQLITTNFRIFLFAVAIFFFSGLSKMLRIMKLNLSSVLIAMMVYQALYYDFFSITGIRQTIATGFFFYAYPYIIKRRFIPYLIMIVLAATIHKSVLILLPFYFISVFPKPRLLLVVSLIALPFLFGLARSFAVYITAFSMFESYAMFAESTYETSGAVSFTAFLVLTVLLILLTSGKAKKMSKIEIISINAMSLAVVSAPLTWVDPSLMRVCQYFSIFTLFILGPAIQHFCCQYRVNYQNIFILVLVVFIGVIIKRGQTYAFFWQEMKLPDNYFM